MDNANQKLGESPRRTFHHTAVNNILKSPEFDIPEAVVFSGHDVSCSGNVVYYPIYMAAFMEENNIPPILEPIEFV